MKKISAGLLTGIGHKLKGKEYLILAALIFLQLVRITYVFAFEREGLHSDETWSYGYANSFYQPYISQNVGEDPYLSDVTPANRNEWLPGKVLWDYLVVGEGETFRYDSVYYNQRGDSSPPLHSMLLHTICSFFPESYSLYYSYTINVVFFVLCQFMLFCLATRLTHHKGMGLLVCAYYGFTTGAVNCFVYLRLYAMLTFWTLALTYCFAGMYQKRFVKMKKECIGAIAVTVLGGFTHYYYLPFAFFMTGAFCFYLLFQKKWRSLFTLAATMLLGVCLLFAIYPYAVMNMLIGTGYYQGGLHYPYYWNVSTCLSLLLRETVGLKWHVDRTTFLILGELLFTILAAGALLCFLFRNETWFQKGVQSVKGWCKKPENRLASLLKRGLKRVNWFAASLFFAIAACLLLIAKISYVEKMDVNTDRYLFYLMPLFVCLLLWGLFTAVKALTAKKKRGLRCGMGIVLAALVPFFFGLNQYYHDYHYLFPTGVENSLKEETKGADCVLVTEAPWRLVWYAGELYSCHSFFLLEGEECMAHTKELCSYTPDEEREVLLIVERAVFQDADIEMNEDGEVVMDLYQAIGFSPDKMVKEDFLEYLCREVDWAGEITYLYSRDSFCGVLDVYRITM